MARKEKNTKQITPSELEALTSRIRSAANFVVLSFGMGVDSWAILLHWLVAPTSRPFDLDRLIVVTSQTGSEWPETIRLVEEHVLPRLKAAGVRFVEIARAQKSQKIGSQYVVLQDTRSPERLHPQGGYSLFQEMSEAGTVVQKGGAHICSIKSKGVPIEAWLKDQPELQGARHHAIGYAKGEESRARKDVAARATKGELANSEAYGIAFGFNSDEISRVRKTERVRGEKGQVSAYFPLIEWAWDREKCLSFIAEHCGVAWPKSCCTYCPFAFSVAHQDELIARFAADPASAVEGLMMEAGALALNPRAKLFETRALRDVLAANDEALAMFDDALNAASWALYRTRRQFTATKNVGKYGVNRAVEILAQGTREEIEQALAAISADRGVQVDQDGPISRVSVRTFETKGIDAGEEIFAAAPLQAEAKAPRFDEEAWVSIQGLAS